MGLGAIGVRFGRWRLRVGWLWGCGRGRGGGGARGILLSEASRVGMSGYGFVHRMDRTEVECREFALRAGIAA